MLTASLTLRTLAWTNTTWILVISGLLVAAVIVATKVILSVRQRAIGGPGGPDREGFSLSDLRAMRGRGELSDDEYARARDVVIRQLGGDPSEATDRDARAGVELGEDFDDPGPPNRGDSDQRRR
ncbi:MAG: hypothetical protein KAS72_15050 [Phycisphaerales bacterium]|nr:hypothetical protein [Phycisphaerales bacterium]